MMEVNTMCCCDSKTECCHPEKKRDPGECSPEKVRECHGVVTEHPCGDGADA